MNWKPLPWYERVPYKKVVELFLSGKSIEDLSDIFYHNTFLYNQTRIEQIIRKIAIRQRKKAKQS